MLSDEEIMTLALAQGQEAAMAGEVPVGAVVVKNGKVIAVGRNASIGHQDPTAHAEIVALRNAARVLGNYRLDGCEIFVTLEPCAMCAGAMLHARVKRMVFGAPDSKTGAAGSVLNLFERSELNHHTSLQGGVLAAQCSALLTSFFKSKRASQSPGENALREDSLRTADARFADLTDFACQENYTTQLNGLSGLRLHYVDMGPKDAKIVLMCLHDIGTWGYSFRKLLPTSQVPRFRVVIPDLIGFGKSDKPKRSSIHTLSFHRNYLLDLVTHLDLRNVILVLPDGLDLWGVVTELESTGRLLSVLVSTHHALPWSSVERAAYEAPYPDAGHKAALRGIAKLFTV
jgi:tRNA(adenine34) deaminase